MSLNLLSVNPRVPIFSWRTFSGPRKAVVPTLRSHRHVCYTTSGRAAIFQALKLIGIGPGDEVLVPTYHCPSMIAPLMELGAAPRFYPIGERGEVRLGYLGTMESQAIKCLLATHYFGLTVDLADVRKYCDTMGIILIEDCAHAFFGDASRHPPGYWGDLAIGSLSKFFSVPEGGCLVSDRYDLTGIHLSRQGAMAEVKTAMDILETSANHDALCGLNSIIRGVVGIKQSIRRRVIGNQRSESQLVDDTYDYRIDQHLANSALPAASRWLLDASHQARIVETRRRNYRFLEEKLSDVPGAHPLFPGLEANCVPYVFPLWVEQPDEKYQVLRQLRIPVFRWDRLWPNTPVLSGDSGLLWSRHVFQLACHQDLDVEAMSDMTKIVRECLMAS